MGKRDPLEVATREPAELTDEEYVTAIDQLVFGEVTNREHTTYKDALAIASEMGRKGYGWTFEYTDNDPVTYIARFDHPTRNYTSKAEHEDPARAIAHAALLILRVR